MRLNYRWPAAILGIASLAVLSASCGDEGMTATLPTADDIVLTEIADGLQRPVQLTGLSGDSRLFIVEQRGRIRVFADGQLRPGPYLDIAGQLSGGNEQGLLGLAFHPDFASNGYAYINYTNGAGDTEVVRFTESADGLTLDPASRKDILFVEQPFGNHNAGQLLFGPDGMLYVPLGDGGSGGDPQGNGQNLDTLLGSILRIDVDGGDPYTIPPDNPFVAGGGRPEIWAYGVRNPWRNDIDVEGGFIYVADVGQNEWEEVSVASLSEAGVNYGWNTVEGPECYQDSNCDRTGLRDPVVSYSHGDGCSITGGHVYRGSAIAGLAGTYFYSDFCSGWLRSFRFDPTQGAAVDQREWAIPDIGSVYSFGRDAAGELYILAGSRAYRIDPAP
ncbi:MAG: PQQ-dependent sugar dehydrogenase [Gemmatimonadetes bacterium]|nr:PQQ-dependent sugar dehydrogenase [Gemmatimonadota bacterium]